MKVIPLQVKKIWPRLKFFKSRSNSKVKVSRLKFLVPVDRSCHKECTYVRPNKKIPLFPVSRPTLIFTPDPSTFYRI